MRVRASLLPILLLVAGCQAPDHGDAPRNAAPAPAVRVETAPPAPPAPEWPHVVVCPRVQHPPRSVTRAPETVSRPRAPETALASMVVSVPGLDDERPLAAANDGGYVVPAIFAKPPEPPHAQPASPCFEPAAPTHASPIEAAPRALVAATLPAPSVAPVAEGSHSLLPLIALAAAAVAVWIFVIVARAEETAEVDPILDTIVDTVADEDEVYIFLDSIEELALDP